MSEIIAVAESLAVGRCGGLSDDQLRELLGNSPGAPTPASAPAHRAGARAPGLTGTASLLILKK